jgi:hypothetical protein
MNYLQQLRDTRAAYTRAIATIDQMRASLRDALDANATANVEGPLYVRDDADELFAPTFEDEQLEALFCDPWNNDSMDADAAHVAELVECGDLCGLTIYGIPWRINDDQ